MPVYGSETEREQKLILMEAGPKKYGGLRMPNAGSETFHIAYSIVCRVISEGGAVFEREAENYAYGCLFCHAGSEQHVVDEILTQNPAVGAIAPAKLRYHRGKRQYEKVSLFPGYVFIKADPSFPVYEFVKQKNIYKILCDSDRNWRLTGTDAEIVGKLFDVDGVIGMSTAYYENGRIRIIDGFLKGREGNIIRVNHRMKTAQIRLDFCKNQSTVWLGFEVIENAADRSASTRNSSQ